jgi:hypothetical protein
MKFALGQRVEIVFNPQANDPRVLSQSHPWLDKKGVVQPPAPGRGEYQTKPDCGTVLEVHSHQDGTPVYLVLVELSRTEQGYDGKPYEIKSRRRRIVPEAKLRAVS